jgi:hypothetical protein
LILRTFYDPLSEFGKQRIRQTITDSSVEIYVFGVMLAKLNIININIKLLQLFLALLKLTIWTMTRSSHDEIDDFDHDTLQPC